MHLPMLTVPRSARCTVGPTAVGDRQCGAPAVTGFVSGSRHFYECAEHNGRTQTTTEEG